MMLAKQLAAGAIGALLALLLYVAIFVVVAVRPGWAITGSGSGGFGLVISGVPMLIATAVGFVLGFMWMRRRLRIR
jgi:hypothetical protein